MKQFESIFKPIMKYPTNTELQKRYQDYCQLIYTFVIGDNPDGPTEWLQNTEERPIIMKKNEPDSICRLIKK